MPKSSKKHPSVYLAGLPALLPLHRAPIDVNPPDVDEAAPAVAASGHEIREADFVNFREVRLLHPTTDFRRLLQRCDSVLRSHLERPLLDVMFELPSRKDVTKCVITRETISKGMRPTLVTSAGAVDETTVERVEESA